MKEELEMQMAIMPHVIEKEYERMFEEFDINKNGVLEKDEAKEMFKELCKDGTYQFSDESFDDKFKEWDADNSGAICKKELKSLLLKWMNDMFKSELAKLEV